MIIKTLSEVSSNLLFLEETTFIKHFLLDFISVEIAQLYFPLFFIILAIIISVFCWDKIILNYEANAQSYGEYANNYYNAHNDTLRYIFFVLFPLIVFFVSYLLFSNKNTYTIRKVLFDKDNLLSIQKTNFYHKVFFILIITFLIIEFLILDFNKFSGYLDYFHTGTFLTPANNFFHTKRLWSSSYIEYGLFGNFFTVILYTNKYKYGILSY